MEWYVVISRTIMLEYGINWAQIVESALTYESIQELFEEQKTALLQSMPDYNKTVVKNEKNILQVEFTGDGCPVLTKIIKVVSLC